MGRYDDISDEHLRSEVARFARILQRMEAKGETLERTGDILSLLGELRRMVFAWEVRCTFDGSDPGSRDPDGDASQAPSGGATVPAPPELDPAPTLSERIVAEARRREEELRAELDRSARGDGEDPTTPDLP